MNLLSKPLCLLALAAAPTVGAAQDAAVRVSGPSPTDLTLESVRLVGPSATVLPVLSGCELLPLVASGQAPLHAADPTRPQAAVVGPGVPALRLPDRSRRSWVVSLASLERFEAEHVAPGATGAPKGPIS